MSHKLIILFFSLFSFVLNTDPKQKQKKDKVHEKKIEKPKVSEAKEKPTFNIIKKDSLAPEFTLTEQDSLALLFQNGTVKQIKKNAHASYYHNKFNGRRTASGKRFDNNKYTAAHKKLPFGTNTVPPPLLAQSVIALLMATEFKVLPSAIAPTRLVPCRGRRGRSWRGYAPARRRLASIATHPAEVAPSRAR